MASLSTPVPTIAVTAISSKHARNRELQVGETHDHVLDPAAKIARDQAEHDADHKADGNRRKPDEQRDPAGQRQAAQDVPAELIGAER